MNILLVEDSRSAAQALSQKLLELGHDVVVATDGLSGIEKFHEDRPDIVIMDIVMPKMSGFEAASRLRAMEASERGAWTPIIFLTSAVSDENLLIAIEAGGDDFLPKTASDAVLFAKMKAMSRIADLRRSLASANEMLHRRANEMRAGYNLLMKFADQVPGIIFQVTMPPEGKLALRYISNEVRSMLELDPEQILADTDIFWSRVHPDDMPILKKEIETSYRHLTPYRVEYRVLLPDRGERWHGTAANPERTDDGCVHWYGHTSDITEKIEYARTLEKAAFIDPLTGLPNRRCLLDRLKGDVALCRRGHHSLAVAFIDLDGFKPVNDRFGHDSGDAVLKAVAARAREALRESDYLARIGGDEFIAVLIDPEPTAGLYPVFSRLLEAVNEPVAFGDHTLQVSASIGVALCPRGGEVPDTDFLIGEADQAMYAAKKLGKNRYFISGQSNRLSVHGGD